MVPNRVIAQACNVASVQWNMAVSEMADRVASATDAFLYNILKGDAKFHQLQSVLRSKPLPLQSAAEAVFGKDSTNNATLIGLVDLAVRARPEPSALSLLPARYHVFARALEGAFVCLNRAGHSDGQPRLYLNRYIKCPECGSHVVEIATCSRCGVIYVVGQLNHTEDTPVLRNLGSGYQELQQDIAYFLLGESLDNEDEDEAVATGDAATEMADIHPRLLCLNCGVVTESDEEVSCNCGSNAPKIPLSLIDLHGHTEPHTCAHCGARSNAGIVFRFLTGQDAPISVLATALYQQLPASSDAATADLPGNGRKLLIFSDSRQDAAFFAPYLERTYDQVLRRRLILKTLLEDESGCAGELRLRDVVERLRRESERAGIFSQRQSRDEQKRMVSTWLMQEFTSTDRRLGLEGLGLLQFRLIKPKGWKAPAFLHTAPWTLSEDEAWNLLTTLIDTLRIQAAVSYLDNVDPTQEDFAPRNRALFVSEEHSDRKAGILSWLPVRGTNRRLNFLLKLLDHCTPELPVEERKRLAKEALRMIWVHFTEPGSVWRHHFTSQAVRTHGVAFRLSCDFWELVPSPTGIGFQCNQCHTTSAVELRGICPTPNCSGQLGPITLQGANLEANHYRALYLHMDPIALSVQEHTAQWTSDEAGKIQQRFTVGEINALSCSTTFELGVDVGELQAVLIVMYAYYCQLHPEGWSGRAAN